MSEEEQWEREIRRNWGGTIEWERSIFVRQSARPICASIERWERICTVS